MLTTALSVTYAYHCARCDMLTTALGVTYAYHYARCDICLLLHLAGPNPALSLFVHTTYRLLCGPQRGPVAWET
jgi:hypothetical protein